MYQSHYVFLEPISIGIFRYVAIAVLCFLVQLKTKPSDTAAPLQNGPTLMINNVPVLRETATMLAKHKLRQARHCSIRVLQINWHGQYGIPLEAACM